MRSHRFLIGAFLLLILLPSLVLGVENEPARRARLQAELDKVNKEIVAQQKLLSAKQKETSSIARDIAILDMKINTAKLNIKAKQIEIERLTTTIGKKVETIGKLGVKLDKGQESLAELLRQTRETDDQSLVELAFGQRTLADLYRDFDHFFTIERSLTKTVDEVRGAKKQTETEKVQLVDRRDAVTDAKNAIESEKRKIEADEKEKQRLLAISKNQEKNYKEVLAIKQSRKQAILNALFNLRDSKAISFGQAYEYSKVAAKGTGVRPAFLLAILTQETNLGKNVGTCNRPGDPESKSWRNIMKPERDLEPYKRIMKELGLEPESKPLSCPQGNGWGGAMGPAQFIPSTWVMFKDRIAKVTGHRPPNPWVAEDAFTASALLLADLGADDQRFTSERRAALKYYAGGNWDNPKNAFYGDSVMKIATNYQSQIDILQE